MSRGGYFVIRPAVILQTDGWADLSCAAVGAWVRLRASAELTEQPVSERASERLGVTADDLETLRAAGLIDDTADGVLAVGMPQPGKNPSDEPAAMAARKAKSRKTAKEAAEMLAASKPPSTPQVNSVPVHSRSRKVTPRHAVTSRDTETSNVENVMEEAIVPTEPRETTPKPNGHPDRCTCEACFAPMVTGLATVLDTSGMSIGVTAIAPRRHQPQCSCEVCMEAQLATNGGG